VYRPPFGRREDPHGQVDGDEAPPANFEQFQRASAGAPWLATGIPPWQLWGNIEVITGNFGGVNNRTSGKQLNKIAYKRPDSWHFFFTARLIDAPVAVNNTIQISFDLILGAGRASVPIPAFVLFDFTYAGAPFPTFTKFASQGVGSDPIGGTGQSIVAEIPASDIQVQANVTNFFGPGPAIVEVGGFWAPKNHIRPDWFLEGQPKETMFAGSETEGR